jgi:hypothetical protein
MNTVTLFAQQGTGKKNIEALCGCFEVDFMYAETFSPDKNYKFHDREDINGGIELVLPVETTDKKMILQHLLVVGDNYIVKHWREDWTYENPVQWKYNGNHNWKKTVVNPETVKGKWTQTVWEVSDAPRYQGYSEWITTDGTTFWQNTTDAPLPRREYSTRDDYNILQRTNRIHITKDGWLHEQDNKKIIRTGKEDKLLAQEKGINSYKRTDMKECEAAKKYWDQYSAYWSKVRSVWDTYMDAHTTVELKKSVEGKALHEFLYALGKEFVNGDVKAADIDSKIKSSIDKFIGPEGMAKAN